MSGREEALRGCAMAKEQLGEAIGALTRGEDSSAGMLGKIAAKIINLQGLIGEVTSGNDPAAQLDRQQAVIGNVHEAQKAAASLTAGNIDERDSQGASFRSAVADLPGHITPLADRIAAAQSAAREGSVSSLTTQGEAVVKAATYPAGGATLAGDAGQAFGAAIGAIDDYQGRL